jgi:E3 ubiquitin-protein ligase RNF14
MEEEEDTREVELSTIAAIFPEELKIDNNDPFTFSIELPVSLSKPLLVKFPALSEAIPAVPPLGSAVQAVDEVDSQELSNLPSLQLHISLPEGYPREVPPTVRISTAPPWLSEEIIARLEGDANRLWEEIGRDQVVFTYIDDVQQSAEKVFGMVSEDNTLEVGPEHKIAILDYDIEAKRKAFEKGSFNCGICLGKIVFLSRLCSHRD